MAKTPIKLTLKRRCEIVEIDDQKYKVLELDGDSRDAYMEEVASRMQYDKDGKPTKLRSIAGIEIRLLSLCLQDPNGNLVKEEELRGWPSSVLKHCGEVARKLSDLDKEDEAEKEKAAKNG